MTKKFMKKWKKLNKNQSKMSNLQVQDMDMLRLTKLKIKMNKKYLKNYILIQMNKYYMIFYYNHYNK